MVRTWEEWRYNVLSAKSLEAFENVHWDDKENISADEILDRVVRYQGGVASGSEIRILVEEIYEVSLREV